MKLQVKRVRFGDCAVLEGRRSRLVADCGGSSQAPDGSLSARDFAYAAIAAQVDDLLPTHILISHLHPNHYRGFLALGENCPPLFRTGVQVGAAYLPWTLLGGRAALAPAFARLYLAAPPRTLAHALARELLELLARLEEEAEELRPVQAGDVLPLDGQKLEVLWPRTETALAKLPLAGGQSFLEADGPMEALCRTALAGAPLGGELLEVGVKLEEALSAYFLLLHGEALAAPARRGALSRLNDLRAQADQLRHTLWGCELRPPYPPWLRPLSAFAQRQAALLEEALEACGVVLQWRDKALLLGDTPAPVLELLRSEGRFHPRYAVVKLPCHGTDRCHFPAIPPADRYILSNGGYRRYPVEGTVLEGLAQSSPDCAFLCTDAHLRPAEDCRYACREGRCHPACVPITDAQAVIPL